MHPAPAATRAEELRPDRGLLKADEGVQLTFFPHVVELPAPVAVRPAVPSQLPEQAPTLLPDDLVGMYYMG